MAILTEQSVPRGGRVATRPAVYGLFFLSGFAALIYQVIWQRVLALFSGADVYSASIIVAAFMAGLGLGSWAGGAVADRLPMRLRIAAFAAAELAIAAFALISLPLYYDVFYVRWVELASSPYLMAGILFAGLLVPTFLMGASLPLLAAAATRDLDEAAGVLGRLYAMNTLGAAAGAFVATWFLARLFGFEAAVRTAAAFNALTGLAALALGPRLALEGGAPRPSAAPPSAAPAFRPGWWFVLYGVSGFIALSLEVLWFRVLGVILKSNAFTFGTLLTVYLAGLAAGAWAAQYWVRRTRDPVRDFLVLQAGVTLYAAASLLLLWGLLDRSPAVAELWRYVGEYEGMDLRLALEGFSAFLRSPDEMWRAKPLLKFVLLYAALPLYVVGPPTLLMGASFTLLHRAAQTDLSRLGRRVGALQGWNIAGATLGALGAGLVLLRFLGTPGTLRILAALGGVFLALLLLRRRGRSLPALAALAGLVLLCIALPGGQAFWAKFHGSSPNEAIVAEDGSGIAALKPLSGLQRGCCVTVFLNGLGQSNVPFPDHHVTLGMAPAMLHPHPTDVAVIGLGSGGTLFGVSGRGETRNLVSIEIVEPLYLALRRLERRTGEPGLRRVMDDRRVTHVFGDGRTFLARGEARFDIIEADALRPTSAYAGNLYSREYFQLLRSRLKPGGLAVTWAPTPRVKETFLSVFPHAVFTPDVPMMIGSDQPIDWDVEAMTARLRSPFSRAHFAAYDPGLVARLEEKLATTKPVFYGPDTDRGDLTDLNADLFPKDELLTPR